MGNKIIPLFKVAISDNVFNPLLKTISSGWIGEGPKVVELENMLKAKFNNPHCLALNSGTSGLRLALELIKRQTRAAGRHVVITTSMTCFATNSPVLTSGLDIRWADIQKDSLNIDPNSIKEKIDENVLAIIVVHWGGYSCDMEEIFKISKEYNVPIIEDGAHTFGSMYKNSMIGSCDYSDFCMISLQAIKFLTTGDGGLLFTKSTRDYEQGKLLRWFGIDRFSNRKDLRCEEDIPIAGFKMQMNDIAATIGINNFDLAEKNVELNRKNAFYYNTELNGVPGVKLVQLDMENRKSSYWVYTLLVDDVVGFARKMGEKGIMVSKVHARNDTHSCVSKYRTELPVLDKIERKRICIPCGWWVTKEDREYIVNVIRKGW